MADRFPGEIKLGGTVKITTVEQRERVETALSLFEQETGHEYGEEGWDGPLNIETFAEYLTDGFLDGKHAQARYGLFEELEEACREAGIAYDRHSSAAYEYDGEFISWRPGMEQPFLCFAQDDGELVLQEKTIRQAIAYLDNDNEPSLSIRIRQARKLLLGELGGDIKDLTPLVIIDEAPKDNDEG